MKDRELLSFRVMTRARLVQTALLGAVALGLPGCLQRTISVTTNPPGAVVWINDVEAGRTPLETDFTFYGMYDVRVRKEGYEPIQSKCRAKSPVKEWVGVDLVSEAIPVRYRTRIDWHFDLVPVAESREPEGVATDSLIARAKETQAQLSPLSTQLPPGPGPAKP